jgi:hypothetical protein
MHRLIAALLMIACLLAPVTVAAQEPGQTSPPPSNLPELKPPSPEMLMKMLELWRQMGPEFPLNWPMLQGLEEFMQSGRLTSEDRQKWEDLSKQMEQWAAENFSPANPKNQPQYQDLINQLQGLVKGWGNADKIGKDRQ